MKILNISLLLKEAAYLEVQLEDGKYSIIFASGLEVDPDSISAVRD